MGVTCAIDGCSFKNRPNTTFHRIPAAPATRDKWVEFIREAQNDPNWMPKKNSGLCSGHFDPKCLCLARSGGLRRLFRHSVPIFLDPSTNRGPLGSINYVQNVLDPTTVAIAALLLQRLSGRYVCRPLNVSLGLDDNGSDSISYAEIDTAVTSDFESNVPVTYVQDLRNDFAPEMTLTEDTSHFYTDSMEISPHSSTNANGLPSTSTYYEYSVADQLGQPCPTHQIGYDRTDLRERIQKDHAYANTITEIEHSVDLMTKLRKAQGDLKVVKSQAKRRKRRILKLNSIIKNMDALFFVKEEAESQEPDT